MKTRHMALFVTVSIIILLYAALAGAAGFALRVNAGDTASYTDKAGNTWSPDRAYTKGSGYGFLGGDTVDRGEIPISGTDDPKIYRTEHYSMDAFVAEVPNGNYTVRLHFAETYDGIDSDSPRVFDVKIQGKDALTGFDIQKTAGGSQKAIVKEFKGNAVTDGMLKISFVARQQNPAINGIEIIAD